EIADLRRVRAPQLAVEQVDDDRAGELRRRRLPAPFELEDMGARQDERLLRSAVDDGAGAEAGRVGAHDLDPDDGLRRVWVGEGRGSARLGLGAIVRVLGARDALAGPGRLVVGILGIVPRTLVCPEAHRHVTGLIDVPETGGARDGNAEEEYEAGDRSE